MKMKWSVFYMLLLVTLIGCGSEEFGTVPKSTKESVDPLKNYSHTSCSTYTLIKPKVDVVYVIDNSASSYYIPSDVKTSISNTINSLSTDFDYRVIGTPLLETASGNNDYQVMTNSTDLHGIPSDSRRISTSAHFSFFSNTPISSTFEKGLSRIVSFGNAHKNLLLRPDAYLVFVLVSNGRDLEVEEDKGTFNGETVLNEPNYLARLASLRSIRTSLNASQLRLFTVTANGQTSCPSGFRTSKESYVKMSKQLYQDSFSTDNSVAQDSYNICDSSGISRVFSAINNSIKQVVRPHEYRYWPITFASDSVSNADIKVTKITPNGSTVELTRGIEWFYEDLGSVQKVQTREGPNPTPGPGEPVTGRYFARFANVVTYPDCVLITSVSKTEYFDYVVLPQKPKPESIVIRINGIMVPKSTTNGWSDETVTAKTINIKAPYPTNADENPPVMRTGFMIKLNDPSKYYKSGDSVEVNFVPAGV